MIINQNCNVRVGYEVAVYISEQKAHARVT